MNEWWNSLDSLNQWFYGTAVFFSVIFLWQFISSLIGLGGEADVDVDADIDAEGLDLDDIEAHSLEEAGQSAAAFKVLSLRAILAFCTMFTWAGAMYLNTGLSVDRSILYALLWGCGGWVVVVLLVNWMRKLAETGTPQLATCVGDNGVVYLDVPDGGRGEIRVMVSGAMAHVRARSADGKAISAGAAIRVVRLADHTTVEVEPAGKNQSKDEAGQ